MMERVLRFGLMSICEGVVLIRLQFAKVYTASYIDVLLLRERK